MKNLCNRDNLYFVKKGFFRYPEVVGKIEPGSVKIKRTDEKNGNILITVKSNLNLKGSITLSEETSFLMIKKALGESDITIGDTPFDEAFLIQAENNYVAHAVLTHIVRKKLHAIKELYEFELTDTHLQYYIPLDDIQKVKDLSDPIDMATLLYREVTYDIKQAPIIRCKKRLMDNILHDPSATVRRNCILMIGSHLRLDGEVVSSLTKVMHEDSDMRNRYEAALFIKDPGLQYLLKMIEMDIDKSLMLDIIAHFMKVQYVQSIEVLKRICEKKSLSVKRKIVKALLIIEEIPDLPFFAAHLQYMKRDACIKLLLKYAEKGDITSVEHLYRIGKESSDRSIRNEAHNAIAMIQSRLKQGDKGWLSIEELKVVDGALSIDNNPQEGSLSIDEDDPDESPQK